MIVIGFDLDMTLIDSRPGVAATMRAISEQSGHAIDIDLATSRLGPPLEHELAHWMPKDQVDRWAQRYREIYPHTAVSRIEALPGARAAIDAVNRRGRSLIISAKNTSNVQLHVDHLDLAAGGVFGGHWCEAKADVLRAEGATMYVGDHPHDMVAARTAGIIGVGVATGGTSTADLLAAGADIALDSLVDFEQALSLLP
ncbi:HAD family hydrolase [Aeromicrobium sp. CF3.5]|uniref:HAD family hydrolase n=1 Tax=Aeromicrobium sp. CF3.5 TaxID=3373078 RepID=UPI003EE78983